MKQPYCKQCKTQMLQTDIKAKKQKWHLKYHKQYSNTCLLFEYPVTSLHVTLNIPSAGFNHLKL